MARKALFFLLLLLTLFTIRVSVVNAQTTNNGPWAPETDASEVTKYREAIENDNCATPSLECLVHQTFKFVAIDFINSSLYSGPEGPNFEGENKGITPKNEGGGVDAGSNTIIGSTRNRGIVGGIGNLIGYMYGYPAAKTSVAVADFMDSAHITPTAYAQGLGFASLNPILKLWKAFRNVAYMFFVVIFIVIGFMIMFRRRIGGQTAVTAQQAIPSVIVSLILVTFSYAISGLMIDFMYVLMFLIIGIFGQTLPSGSTQIIDYTILNLMGELFKPTIFSGDQVDLVTNIFGSLIDSSTVTGFLGFAGGLTLTIVLAIAILIGTIKLFFELLKSYASIILSVVTSPIILMMGALPGNNAFGPWIKDLFGNLLPFPVVLLVVILFYQFTDISGLGGAGNEGGFIPPFLIARGQAGAITSLMGLALILALPEIVKDVKKKFVKEGFGTMVVASAGKALESGWKGGELIPGFAATNTNNIPVVGKYLGSGKSALTSGLSVAGGAAGLVGGTVAGLDRVGRFGGSRQDLGTAMARGFRFGARAVGDTVGSNIYTANRDERRKTSVVLDPHKKVEQLSNKEGK